MQVLKSYTLLLHRSSYTSLVHHRCYISNTVHLYRPVARLTERGVHVKNMRASEHDIQPNAF